MGQRFRNKEKDEEENERPPYWWVPGLKAFLTVAGVFTVVVILITVVGGNLLVDDLNATSADEEEEANISEGEALSEMVMSLLWTNNNDD